MLLRFSVIESRARQPVLRDHILFEANGALSRQVPLYNEMLNHLVSFN